ncbi:MAG: hypothetical protein Q9M48_07555 [Rhodobacterales bacterium]|nr:hypothetical protein [Rhodobacterales bacterium]
MPRQLWVAGLLGSVAPELDLFRFYFVDHCAHHHHDYITHRPLFWLDIFGLGLLMIRLG